MKRTSIRALARGETPPPGEPRRYVNSAGYVRLRWKAGPREYVETYERDKAGTLLRETPSRQRRIDVERAAALYAEGYTMPQVAEQLGCDHGNLSRALRRAGVRPRTRGDYYPVDEARVLDLFKSGVRPSDIAWELGTRRPRIDKILRAAGVIPHRPGRPYANGRGPKYETVYEAARRQVRLRSGGSCEARVPEVCTGRAEHCHHRLPRGRGGGNELANLVDCCGACHRFIHAYPAESYVLGLLVHTGAVATTR